jgi:integrase
VRQSGSDRAKGFGPQKLMAVRDEMVRLGWTRPTINKQIGRIRRCFKWGVQQELIPPETLMGLQTVPGLRAGRSAAKEADPVLPVSTAAVDAVKPFVSRQVWAMIQLQRLTGARPGEIAQMRGCDLNMAGELWEYRPESHKTQHHGRERIIILGKAAQTVVREFLRPDLAEFLFSPADARREFDERRKAGRKTPMTPSHQARRRRRKPRRQPGERYSKSGYSGAVRKACEKAFGMPPELRNVSTALPDDERETLCAEASAWRKEHCWNPHQLRHTAATEIRRAYGLEAAQVVLGHSDAHVTEIYAERDLNLAKQVAAKIG